MNQSHQPRRDANAWSSAGAGGCGMCLDEMSGGGQQKTLTRRRRLVIRVHLLLLLFATEKFISGENKIWFGEASLDELAEQTTLLS